jgi:hypothetical protein
MKINDKGLWDYFCDFLDALASAGGLFYLIGALFDQHISQESAWTCFFIVSGVFLSRVIPLFICKR